MVRRVEISNVVLTRRSNPKVLNALCKSNFTPNKIGIARRKCFENHSRIQIVETHVLGGSACFVSVLGRIWALEPSADT